MRTAKLIATFFGLGYIPFAPGTFGAFGGLLISFGLSQYVKDLVFFNAIHLVLILLSYFAGVYACRKLAVTWGSDPSRVVIDETFGFWISILFLPAQIAVLLGAFVFFRFFDIFKPLGIRKIDAFHTPQSVMLDDALAGVYANLLMQAIVYVFNTIS